MYNTQSTSKKIKLDKCVEKTAEIRRSLCIKESGIGTRENPVNVENEDAPSSVRIMLMFSCYTL